MQVGRVTAFTFMLLAAAWAPFIESFGSLFKYLQTVLAFIAPPIVVVFLLGVLWRGMTARAAFLSLMAGLVMAVALLVGQVTGHVELHFLHIAGLLFAVCFVLAVVLSLLAPDMLSESQASVLWSASNFREEVREQGRLPWYRNYLVLSALLLVVTAALVVIHR
jgi:SSS family solute:Na+ symporter